MFDLQTFTIIHTAISLVALVAGLWLLPALSAGRAMPALGTITIVLLVLTSATGFGFPFIKILPSHVVGVLSLLVLAVTIWARYVRHLAGSARVLYGISLTIAIYFDAFVGVVQAFLKIPALHALAPTQQSPGFVIAQGILLVIFIGLGVTTVRGLRRSAI